MSATRRKFSTECKVEAAHRVIDSGSSITVVARELGVPEVSLGNWVRAECRPIEAARGTDLEPRSLTITRNLMPLTDRRGLPLIYMMLAHM